MFCPRCGANIKKKAMACEYCGVVLDIIGNEEEQTTDSICIEEIPVTKPTETSITNTNPFVRIRKLFNAKKAINRLVRLCIIVILITFAVNNFEIWISKALGETKDLNGEVTVNYTISDSTIEFTGTFKSTCTKHITTARFTIEFKDTFNNTVADSTVLVHEISPDSQKQFSGSCIIQFPATPTSYQIVSVFFT